MTETLFRLDHASLSGDGRPRIEADLEITAGLTAVIGASGAGKTSLLNLLVGFERPDTGEVQCGLDSDSNRLPLFWLPPDGGLWPGVSAIDQVTAVLPEQSDHAGDAGRAEELLRRYDLQERSAAVPEELSAGERARLAVARGLATEATVLVMDEPLVHVDPARIAGYWEHLADDCLAHDSSLVFSTHDPDQVLRHAQRVLCVAEGRVIGSGPVADLYQRPPTREVAECLGPVNWFEPGEQEAWLGRPGETGLGLRAEALRVIAQEGGSVEVVASASVGPVRETRARLVAGGQERLLRHLHSGRPLEAGMPVRLEIVLAASEQGAPT